MDQVSNATTKSRDHLLKTLVDEEDIEVSLIELYNSLLSLGVENCFPPNEGLSIRNGMKVLADESRIHRVMIDKIKANY